jgi:CRISPR/Cas system-associated exonuclease Cas4 (RecB family)
MINDQTLDRKITALLTEANNKERSAHKSSGKLSASMLGWPLQWQMLKNIGIEGRKLDEYVLRKFLRGRHVEEWLVNHMEGVVEKQKFVEYQDAIGYVDVIVDHAGYESKVGVIPHEVKSVSNFKYKRIIKQVQADPQHQLQSCFYALALNKSHYAIDYVSTDDYRIYSMVYEVNGVKDKVDEVIKKYKQALKDKVVPVFEPVYAWQKNLEYNNYPQWMDLTAEQIVEKLKTSYPDNYKLLTKKI